MHLLKNSLDNTDWSFRKSKNMNIVQKMFDLGTIFRKINKKELFF